MIKEAFTANELVNTPSWIQPIMTEGFTERYKINLRDGTIYDLEDCTQIIPEIVDGQLMVTLTDENDDNYKFLLGDLLIRVIYGYTNSSFRPPLTEYPCTDIGKLVPKIHHWNELDDRRIEINGIIYYRWLNTEYFASSYGVVYSVPYGSFLRRAYNEKGYCVIATRENGRKRGYRLHRIVWESHNECQIPADKEIDHINDKRWDNRISNLQLLSHLENLQKINPEKFKSYPAETIIAIGKDLQNGVPTKIISEKYGILREKVWEIKFRNFYSEILNNAGVDLSNTERDGASQFNKAEVIKDIYQMYNNNIPVIDIADKYKVTPGYIHQILRRNADIKSA